MAYDIGDAVRSRATFKNLSQVLTDPTTVVVTVRDASGNGATYTYGVDAAVEKEGTGVYHIDVEPDEKGIWRCRWSGMGAIKTAEEHSFVVRTRRVTTRNYDFQRETRGRICHGVIALTLPATTGTRSGS